MFRKLAVAAAAATSFLCQSCEGYYVPQYDEILLKKDSPEQIWVNSLTSQKAVVPLGFYSLGLFPKPDVIERETGGNMGMIFSGDILQNSVYKVTTLQDQQCVVAGNMTIKKNTLVAVDNAIRSQYRVNMMISRMQAAHKAAPNSLDCYGHHHHARGFPLGCPDDDGNRINTHVKFVISYNVHKEKRLEKLKKVNENRGKVFVTDFKVIASDGQECGSKVVRTTRWASVSKTVVFTYDVEWVYDNSTTWGSRWNRYIDDLVNDSADTDNDTERQSLLTCIIVVICFSFLVAMIVMRTLHLDFNRYNNPDNEEERQEEVGWKYVHGDVFRPPSNPNFLALLVGTGAQLLGVAFSLSAVAVLGTFYPGARGKVFGFVVSVFCLMAFLNGFVTGRIQMAFGVRNWKTVVLAALSFPSIVFILWVITEIALSRVGASNSMGIKSVLLLLVVWLGVSLPLVIAGAAFSYKREAIDQRKYNTKQREIKYVSWLFTTPAQVLLPSIVIFTLALIELKLIFGALWQGRVLHLFGFLFTTAVLVMVVTAEVTIVSIYYQLVYEDWRWWWSSILIPSGVGIYTFLFSINYQVSVLELTSGLAIWIFYVVTFTLSLAFSLMCGTVGFYSSWYFTCKIYSALKTD